jgi:hypothetical protein
MRKAAASAPVKARAVAGAAPKDDQWEEF